MAVEDKYINSEVVAGKKGKPARSHTSHMLPAIETFEVAAADDDGSKYRVFKGLSANLIPLDITVMCDAITGSTDWDLGFYKTDGGAVILKDALMDGQTLASASKVLDGLSNIAIENRGKRLWELAGHTEANKLASYDLVLTANTVGSAAGTVTVKASFAQG